MWPLIKDDVERIIGNVFANVRGSVDEWIESRRTHQEGVARRKAEEAEQKASRSDTAAEVEKYRSVAEAWREAAELFRAENAILKSKLDLAISESEKQLTMELDEIDVATMIEERSDGKLSIRGSDVMLSLPMPEDDAE